MLRLAVAVISRLLLALADYIRLRCLGRWLSCSTSWLELLIILPCATRHIAVRLVALRLLDQLDDLLRVSELRVVASRLAHYELLLFNSVHGVSLVSLSSVVSCRCPSGAIVAATLDVIDKLDLVGAENLVALSLLALLGLGLLLDLLTFVVAIWLVTLAFSLFLALVTLLDRGDFADLATIADLLMGHARGLSCRLRMAFGPSGLNLDILLVLTAMARLLLRWFVRIISVRISWGLI